jgi:cell division inhibitor SepF
MASMWKKAMTYLGLGDDDAYADYELEPEVRRAPPSRPQRPARPPVEPPGRDHDGPREPRQRPPRPSGEPRVRDPREPTGDVAIRGGGQPRPAPPDIADPGPASGVGAVTPRSAAGGTAGGAGLGGRGPVRPIPVPVSARPHLVTPTSFNGVQEVADHFKAKAPVVMDLSSLDRELSRRLIDFASGLCYALGGTIDRVGTGRYLLTPPDITVSAEDRQRLGLSG